MVAAQGGLSATSQFLSSTTPASGFMRLWKGDRLDLSVEALAIQEPWSALFSCAELTTARRWLEDLGYDPGESA